VRSPPPRPQLHQTRLARTTSLRRRQRPPLSILSVGYTRTASGYPPLAPARQRKRRVIASDPQPGKPGRCEVRSEPCRGVAATARSPQTMPDKRLLIPPERGACRLVSHRNMIRFGRCATEAPKDLPGARNVARNFTESVRRRRRLAVRRACCHALCGTACDRSATKTERGRVTVPAGRNPLSPITSCARRPRRKRRHQPSRLHPQAAHSRSPT